MHWTSDKMFSFVGYFFQIAINVHSPSWNKKYFYYAVEKNNEIWLKHAYKVIIVLFKFSSCLYLFICLFIFIFTTSFYLSIHFLFFFSFMNFILFLPEFFKTYFLPRFYLPFSSILYVAPLCCTRAYLFSPIESFSYFVSTWNTCC